MRAPIVLVVSWLVLDPLFTVLADHQGLLAPFGPVHLAPALLGLVVIALRLVVTFLLMPWAAWRLGARPHRRGSNSIELVERLPL